MKEYQSRDQGKEASTLYMFCHHVLTYDRKSQDIISADIFYFSWIKTATVDLVVITKLAFPEHCLVDHPGVPIAV